MIEHVLELRGLTKAFAGVHALQDVSFSVASGSITGLIGPNGSGKTTLIDCVTGFLDADSGQVLLRGRDISGAAPHQLARLGMIRTFQSAHGYARLTVLDHMLLASQEFEGIDWLHAFLKTQKAKAADEAARARALELLALVRLADYSEEPAGSLSFGQQKLLSMAAALMSEPTVVLLDEPLSGVTPAMIDEIARTLRSLNAFGHTFLIVEHNVRFVTAVCDTIIVLDAGKKVAEGPAEVIWSDRRIYEAYLGGRPG